MVQHNSYTYNGGPIESRMWSIERRHFQWPWTTPTPSFKVTSFFDAANLTNGRTCIVSMKYGLPTGTYTRPTQQRHFEWPWVTVSDLAIYSITWSVTRSLCDSWASCNVYLPARIWERRVGCVSYWLRATAVLRHCVRPTLGTPVKNILAYNAQVECDRLTAVAMKQTLGRQVGEVREHECNMHVCVGVG